MIRFAVPWPVSSFAVGEFVTDAEDPDDVAGAIKEHAEAGAQFTKIAIDQQPLGIPSHNKETARIIVQESKVRGKKVGAHVGSEADVLTALDAGIEYFVHAPYRSSLSGSTINRLLAADATIVAGDILIGKCVGLNAAETARGWVQLHTGSSVANALGWL